MKAASSGSEFAPTEVSSTPAVHAAVLHSLVWLVLGNAMGVMLALLLLAPRLNAWLGEWTYGRWMMVHMNILLFGWCAFPMLAFLYKVYGADSGTLASWCRPVAWLWSGALAIGSASWLSGHSSGKLFLDWSGYARIFFPLAMGALWLLLTASFMRRHRADGASAQAPIAAKALGLVALLVVPFAIYFASSPDIYPVVNPDTGGPTGADQLQSSLAVVLILLLVPFGIAKRNGEHRLMLRSAWLIFAAEALLCALLGRADASHRLPSQYLSLGSMLVWIYLVPAYFCAFRWNPTTRRWRTAVLWWWAGLVLTGWISFLPGVLDRIKFTDALVGHSLVAVAGFLSAFLILVMLQLMGERDAWIFNRTWSFYAWNLGVLAYVLVISVAGWIEGGDPAFTIIPGGTRNWIYFIRLLTGVAMLAGSVEWLAAAASLNSPARRVELEPAGEKAA